MLRSLILFSVLLVFGLFTLSVSAADDSTQVTEKAADDSIKVSDSVSRDITKERGLSPEDFGMAPDFPTMTHEEVPRYPASAEKAGIIGSVWVKALVDEKGDVREAEVYKSSGNKELDDAALEAALKNKYKAAVAGGEPVAVWVAYRVDFKLDH